LSVVTIVFVVVLLFVSRHHLEHAWKLLSEVNLGLLALVIPITAATYLASGEMIFSYLRQKKLMGEINPWTLMRVSLELNFVNHVLPSGGVSGVSYLNWRMGKLGVSTSRATMAQAIRYAAGFAAMTTLLALSVLMVTIDGNINRWIILMSSMLVFVMIVATVGFIYVVRSPSRMHHVSEWLEKWINRIVRKVTRGKVAHVVDGVKLTVFLDDMHDDYVSLSRDKRVLLQPYLWGMAFTMLEIALFYVTFLALGASVNPASILIAYGVASLTGFAVVTPGGAGAYEAVMVAVLATAGLKEGQAIAGIILARVIILLVTIVLGYVFYQMTLVKYGKQHNPAA
ncbi:MAG: lysylphosphatidylglycerol synthase transmembrane domain-containing protein, partial [Candidatus Saccharimonas sp.]